MRIGIALYPGVPYEVREILKYWGGPVAEGEYKKVELPDRVIRELQNAMNDFVGALEVPYQRFTGSDDPVLKSRRIWHKQASQADEDSKRLYRRGNGRDERKKEAADDG